MRALNADAFGAEKSDSNRAGLDAAPNTNAFAVEGSNPIWAVDGDSQRFPDFDEQRCTILLIFSIKIMIL